MILPENSWKHETLSEKYRTQNQQERKNASTIASNQLKKKTNLGINIKNKGDERHLQ